MNTQPYMLPHWQRRNDNMHTITLPAVNITVCDVGPMEIDTVTKNTYFIDASSNFPAMNLQFTIPYQAESIEDAKQYALKKVAAEMKHIQESMTINQRLISILNTDITDTEDSKPENTIWSNTDIDSPSAIMEFNKKHAYDPESYSISQIAHCNYRENMDMLAELEKKLQTSEIVNGLIVVQYEQNYVRAIHYSQTSLAFITEYIKTSSPHSTLYERNDDLWLQTTPDPNPVTCLFRKFKKEHNGKSRDIAYTIANQMVPVNERMSLILDYTESVWPDVQTLNPTGD